MVNKKHGKQNRKKVWNLHKAFSLRTIKVCLFDIIGDVKYFYCIKHAYKFLLREQVGLRPFFDACFNVFLVYSIEESERIRRRFGRNVGL